METIKQLRILLFLTILSFAGLTACEVNNSAQTGSLQVKMTDAPGHYEEVWVDVQSVRVHQTQTAETSAEESDQEAEEEGWITIMDEPTRIDLLTLRNGNEITLGEAELDPGTYSQLRLILGDNNEVVIDGESHDLMTPSQQESGTKLNINATVEEDQTYTLLVDFDAGRSIVQTGNGMYILKPVLRAVNLSETGSIAGDVSPADVQTSVLAINGDDTLSTLTDTDGAFTIMGVAPGSYNVEYKPDSDQYRDSTVTGVEVTAGETTTLETMNLESSN